MARQANALDMVRSSIQLSNLVWESQMVIAMRMMGMAGMWSVAATENEVMAAEKPTAFVKAAISAGEAATAGKRSDEVLNAWTRSMRRETGANMRRLAKRGPKFGV
ncbi:MAG: antifreeze protein [Paracoccaceae bacterium]